MNWLVDNSVANMRGPMFLAFFAGVTFILIITCRSYLRSLDQTRNRPSPHVPPEPSPREITYLRGGKNELLRLLILELVQRGYLQVKEDSINRAHHHPDAGYLGEVERACFNFFCTETPIRGLFDGPATNLLDPWCAELETRAREEELLLDDSIRSRARNVFATSLVLLLGLAGYKAVVALSRGHFNLGFLMMMTIAAGIILRLVCWANAPRLSARGREFIERLQVTLSRFKPSLFRRPNPETIETNLLLIASVFGLAALHRTTYAHCSKAFAKAAAPQTFADGGTGSGCSSCGSTSSSSSSGSGCSSGGSSCGGGGCGGCGGGD